MSISLPNFDGVALQGKNVFVRVDLNVPVKDGKILDKTRIHAIVPTIEKLLKASAKIILLAHFGRPYGQNVPNLSLEFLQNPLKELLKVSVHFSSTSTGPETKEKIKSLKEGEILLLENLRFNPGEEANDPSFAKALAQNADFYINDAFAVSHRAHASVDAITCFLPSFAGLLLEKEVQALTKALTTPKRPLVAIVSGSKVSTKLTLLKNLIEKVDTLILGGGLAHTFRTAQGFNLQNSLVEKSMIPVAKEILSSSAAEKIVLPVDGVAGLSLKDSNPKVYKTQDLPPDLEFFDAGPESIKNICRVLENHKTLVWNGPLGVFEHPPFDQATTLVARHVAQLTQKGQLYSIAGGGETVAALTHAGVQDRLSDLSTAGGAFLEWLEGKPLPGIQALGTA
ncbi:MAG: phosphoglycerate kinase [bacterium]|nr:phosphoglycerate kinase [bacterium]